jgi:hypothetical protein
LLKILHEHGIKILRWLCLEDIKHH